MARLGIAGLVALLGALPAAAAAAEAQAVFERFGDRVVQVRILERSTGSKIALGSGFFVTPEGHLVTNFHVVSELVHDPEHVRAEIVEEGGAASPIELLAFDVVRDLAVARVAPDAAGPASRPFLELAPAAPQKGARLFSLGNPYDLGSSIVEGTYNGLLDRSLYEKIHFTAPINPGMSGGPAIDADGRVVGVNVSTAGNELSFLVPVSYVAPLRAEVLAPGWLPPADATAVLAQQVLDNQARLVEPLLAEPLPSISLGDYRVPGELPRHFKCWGSKADTASEEPYERIGHSCSTEDSIFIADDLRAGSIGFDHTLLRTSELNPLQFYALYQSRFQTWDWRLFGARDQVGSFVCETGYVQRGPSTLKTVLCLRGYKKLAGVYDALFKAASLDSNHAGIVTSMRMSGVSYENAGRLTRHYLEAISWNP